MINSVNSLGVFVISLPAAYDRRAHMQQELSKQGISFSFFDALNGEQAQRFLSHSNLYIEKNALTLGEIGCASSHIALWQRLVKSPAETMVVLEDDIFLGQDARDFLLAVDWLPYPASAQLVKLEKYQDAVFLSRAKKSVNGRGLHLLMSDHWGTAGYVIGREVAQQMLNCLAAQPLARPIDHFMFDTYREMFPQAVWQLNPAICIQDIVHQKKIGLGSDLAAAREQRQAVVKKAAMDDRINFWVKQARLLRPSYWQMKIRKIYQLKKITFF